MICVTLVIDCINGCNELRGPAKFILNKLFLCLLNTQTCEILFQATDAGTFLRTKDCCKLRFTSLESIVPKVLEFKREFLLNRFVRFFLIFLTD